MPFQTPFIPGNARSVPGPLSRFLPPISPGTASTWLESIVQKRRQKLNKSTWIVDPFCSSPQLVIKIAQSGYCVLVSAVNPITRYILEILAESPVSSDMRSSLASLGSSYKGSERLEPHIKSLYQTRCPECDQWIIADAYIWEKDSLGPTKRIFHCSTCGLGGEFPATQLDIELANKHRSPLLKARALERVAPLHDPDRENAEHALGMYLDRSLYALFTLISKLELQSEKNQALLRALMISVCDRASKLWHYPAQKTRPRQLAIPPQYFETNLWKALENSIDEWSSGNPDTRYVPITIWPEIPPTTGGICIFEGRLKDLSLAIQSVEFEQPVIDGVVFAYPRPNQAFWTFSVIWSRWLFPSNQTQQYKSVLRRRRFDWSWHTNALFSTLNHLKEIIPPGTPIFGLVGEAEPGFITASTLANDLAELQLTGFALRKDINEAQLHLIPDTNSHGEKKSNITPRNQNFVNIAITKFLHQLAEPAKYLQLYTSALITLSKDYSLTKLNGKSPAEKYLSLHQSIEEAIVKNKEIHRIKGSEYSLDVGEWWLNQPENLPDLSLSDRVEIEVIRYLKEKSDCSLIEIDTYLCTRFPGLFTPDSKLVETCLSSYACQLNADNKFWRLKEQESNKTRDLDILHISELLIMLGEKLGFVPESPTESQVTWSDPDGNLMLNYVILATAIITPIIYSKSFHPNKGIIVVPGSRANLIAYRSRHDPRINMMMESGLRIIKFRHIRRITNEKDITIDKFNQMLEIDPLKRNDPQLPLL